MSHSPTWTLSFNPPFQQCVACPLSVVVAVQITSDSIFPARAGWGQWPGRTGVGRTVAVLVLLARTCPTFVLHRGKYFLFLSTALRCGWSAS